MQQGQQQRQQPRCERMAVRITTQQREQVEDAAQVAGVSLSEVIRRAVRAYTSGLERGGRDAG